MDHMAAKVSCFARAYHHKHNETHIFDDNAAERFLGEDYAQIAKNMTEGLPFFFPNFEGTKEEGLRLIVDKQLSPSVLVSSILRLSGKWEIENGCRNKYNEIIKSSGRNIICMIKVIEEKILWKTDRLCYLFLIFLAGCMVGWIYEEIFYWITEGMLRNRGILYGPWLPIYGIGALGIYAMKPVKKYPALLFFLCAVVSGIVEYIIGYIGINFLGMRLWDYRGLLWNLDGIICFRSVISFAVMGVMFHYMLEPAAEQMVGKISSKVLRETCMVLLIIFVVDCVLSALFRTPITY